MKYFIQRNGQEFGPYTLADLQRYVAQGNIVLTDLARSEGLEEWVTVERVLGNVPVPSTPPPPQGASYGQVPTYGAPSGMVGNQAGVAVPSAGPMPPNMHWAVVLLLTFITCGLFGLIWMFVQASFVNKLGRGSNALLLYSIGIPLTFLGQFAQIVQTDLGGLIVFIGVILTILGHFQMKAALEGYYTNVEPIHLRLSGVLVFFFNVLYFQYHLSRIRQWKLTGVLA